MPDFEHKKAPGKARRHFPMLNLTAFGGAEISSQKNTLRSNTENSPTEARKG